MEVKRSHVDDLVKDKGVDIVTWTSRYVTGIKLIDQQHKELLSLTNDLYHACLSKSGNVETAFKEAMGRMVQYVRFHFDAEQELLQRIGYPRCGEHKKLHDELIKRILEAAKDHGEGKKFVPNNFVRTLADWIFGHIGIEDRKYAAYMADQRKKGLLPDERPGSDWYRVIK